MSHLTTTLPPVWVQKCKENSLIYWIELFSFTRNIYIIKLQTKTTYCFANESEIYESEIKYAKKFLYFYIALRACNGNNQKASETFIHVGWLITLVNVHVTLLKIFKYSMTPDSGKINLPRRFYSVSRLSKKHR